MSVGKTLGILWTFEVTVWVNRHTSIIMPFEPIIAFACEEGEEKLND